MYVYTFTCKNEKNIDIPFDPTLWHHFPTPLGANPSSSCWIYVGTDYNVYESYQTLLHFVTCFLPKYFIYKYIPVYTKRNISPINCNTDIK